MTSRGRNLAAAAALGVVVLVALIGLGRWERSRNAAHQNRRLAQLRALVGPLGGRSLSGYRIDPEFDCLTYRRGANVFAIELCFDAHGRLIEGIDRRTETRRIASLRSDPSAASVVVPHAEIGRLLRRMRVAG